MVLAKVENYLSKTKEIDFIVNKIKNKIRILINH